MSKRENYSASEVCGMLEVKPYVLRFWESEFTEIDAKIDLENGHKLYNDKSLRAVKVIKHLLFVEKLSIEQAKGLILKHGIDGLTLQFFAHELEQQFAPKEEEIQLEEVEQNNLSQNRIENFFGQSPFEEVYGEAMVEEVKQEIKIPIEEVVETEQRPCLGASEMQKLVLAKAKLNSILSSIEGIQSRTNLS